MPAAMSPSALAVVGLGLAACQTAAEARAVPIAVHGDGVDVELTRVASGCESDGAVIVVGGDVVSRGGWRLAAGPSGRELTDHGALVARIVDEPRRRSYLDATGVPLGRVALTADGGTISGPSRDVIGTVTRDGERLRWRDAAGRTRATITGTDDLDVALALIAPSTLPPAARALVACARLSATSPSPAK